MSSTVIAKKFFVRVKNGEFRYIAKRIFPGGNRFFYLGRQFIFECPDPKAVHGEVKGDRYLVSRASSDDIEKLCIEYPNKKSRFTKRLSLGDSCFVAKEGEVIAGYVWAKAPRPVFDTNSLYRFRSQKSGVWFFDLFVKPEHRRKGLFSSLVSAVVESYPATQCQVLYSETYHTNCGSIAAHKKMGAHVVADVRYISILGLKMYLCIEPRHSHRSVQIRYSLDVNKHKL